MIIWKFVAINYDPDFSISDIFCQKNDYSRLMSAKKTEIEKTGSAVSCCFETCMLTHNFKKILCASSGLSARYNTISKKIEQYLVRTIF
jgi:hypothetical protein